MEPEQTAGPTAGEEREQGLLLLLLLTGMCAAVFLRTAWVSEDAYITFRTIDNLLDGYGLRWNVAERVQTFTHPLWMMLVTLVVAVTREFFFSVSLLSVLLSTLGVWLLVTRIARSSAGAVIGVVILLLSRAFVDYSTSGLENPLTHLLLVVQLWLYLRIVEQDAPVRRRDVLLLSVLAGLGMLNRLDTALIFLPPVVHLALRLPRWRWRLQAAGVCFAPVALWLLFSLVYYGFPWPNTAYAKLNTGIHPSELVEQGFYYLLNSLSWDPVTLLVIGAVAIGGLLSVRRQVHRAVVAVGILLYLYYVVRIGGDFMSGRFLAAPLLAATVLLLRWRPFSLREGVLLVAPVVALGLSSGQIPLKSSDRCKNDQIDSKGIADERGFYFPKSGLLKADRSTRLPKHTNCETGRGIRRSGRLLAVEDNIGFMAFCAGPDVHFIDRYALGDVLLARLPVETVKGKWRIGHFARVLPEGYQDALRGDGKIVDADLRSYWEHLKRVTRGDLIGWQRIKAIWQLNTGGHDHLLDDYLRRQYFIVDPSQLTKPRAAGSPWNAPDNLILNRHGVGIRVGQRQIAGRSFALGLNGGQRYLLLYLHEGRVLHRQRLSVKEGAVPGMVVAHVTVPESAVNDRFDQLRITPDEEVDRHSVGHFEVTPGVMRHRLAELRRSAPLLLGRDRVLWLSLPGPAHDHNITVQSDRGTRYRLAFLDGDLELFSRFLRRFIGGEKGMQTHRVRVPPTVARHGYDGLLLTPVKGNEESSIGQVRLR